MPRACQHASCANSHIFIQLIINFQLQLQLLTQLQLQLASQLRRHTMIAMASLFDGNYSCRMYSQLTSCIEVYKKLKLYRHNCMIIMHMCNIIVMVCTYIHIVSQLQHRMICMYQLAQILYSHSYSLHVQKLLLIMHMWIYENGSYSYVRTQLAIHQFTINCIAIAIHCIKMPRKQLATYHTK